MKIRNVLTDNAVLFTDRFNRKDRVATSRHVFGATWVTAGIQHRLCPPRRRRRTAGSSASTGASATWSGKPRFASAAALENTFKRYLATYHHPMPQLPLKHQTPIQALPTRQAEKPDLFVKQASRHTGLDTKRQVNILCESWSAKVQDAVLLMQQQASNCALGQGTKSAEEPAVAALYEKQFAGCLSACLGKQPDIRPVPCISVKHWQSQP